MSRIHVEYLHGCFDEKEVIEITQLYKTYDVDVILHEKHPHIVNAAFDELVETILLFINAAELQTGIAIFNIAAAISSVTKWMWEKLKSKKLKKITRDTIEEKDANIIVQVDNVKILLDKKATDEELAKYLYIALCESKRATKEEAGRQIVIEGDNNTVNVYYLEEFAKKTIGNEYKRIRAVSRRKSGKRNR